MQKLFSFLVVVSIFATAASATVARLSRSLAMETRLRQQMEEQLRLSADTKLRVRDLVSQKKALEQERLVLEKQVLEVEAEVAQHQHKLIHAQGDASKGVQDLQGHLAQAMSLWQETGRQVDESHRRLCDTLTEQHGALQLVCRGALRDMSPELAKVMQWLHQQHFTEQTKNTRRGALVPMVKMMAVWGLWLAVFRTLTRAAQKTHKTD